MTGPNINTHPDPEDFLDRPEETGRIRERKPPRSRQRRYQLRQIALGKCEKCGEMRGDSPFSTRCELCGKAAQNKVEGKRAAVKKRKKGKKRHARKPN